MKLALEIVGLIDGILFAYAIISYAVLGPSGVRR
jgi:hypothetical protein